VQKGKLGAGFIERHNLAARVETPAGRINSSDTHQLYRCPKGLRGLRGTMQESVNVSVYAACTSVQRLCGFSHFCRFIESITCAPSTPLVVRSPPPVASNGGAGSECLWSSPPPYVGDLQVFEGDGEESYKTESSSWSCARNRGRFA
jgi:hypothetical protein